MLQPREPTFLVVDDDDVAAMTIERVLKRLGSHKRVRARDGVEALERLRAPGERKLPRPYVVLLDINMPGMGGLDFLDQVRADPELRNSVIFMVTTSDAAKDIQRAYDRAVAGYIVRSGAAGAMRSALEMIMSYCKVVRLPD